MTKYLSLVIIAIAGVLGLASAWPYGEEKVRGVNVGGWLVLESWMSPQLFEGLPVHDEYTYTQYLGKEEALRRLREHWDTWATEEDFAFFKEVGLNHVRLPIGYWALDIAIGEPWVNGSWEYVVKAAEWCKRYELQLMIDLHGAPGSQNGWDHSGQSGEARFYYNEGNIRRAVRIMGRIAEWANSTEWRDTVTIIQLLNEPFIEDDLEFKLATLKDYYQRGYDEIRVYNPDVVVAFHDAFINMSEWYYFGDNSSYHRMMIDTHHYQVFGDHWWQDMTCEDHVQFPCGVDRFEESEAHLWTVVGEWSAATPWELECGPVDTQLYVQQQIAAFEKASGYFFWSHYNGQGMREWSFRHAYNESWIDPTAPNLPMCG